MRLALAVTMLDEMECVQLTLAKVGKKFAHIEIVQSGEPLHLEIEQSILAHKSANYVCLPDLDTRSDEEKAGKGERFDVGARAQSRNYSAAFGAIGAVMRGGKKIDYVVGTHGDTAIVHMYGIEWIIDKMKKAKADIGVSRAMGQDLHAATLTREQMADPDHPKGGRLQDATNKDFMPQFFVAKSTLVERLSCIEVTNSWCMEQCIGDAIGDAVEFVFSKTAYGFADGIIYHIPSPRGWKH